MNKFLTAMTRTGASLLLAALSGCETTGDTQPARAGQAAPRPEPTAGAFPKITLETTTGQSLGGAIRAIGEQHGGGAVLLSGMEDWPVPDIRLSGTDYVKGLQRLASLHDYRLQETPYYVFIYPAGYEQLESLSLQGEVAPEFDSMHASYAIGSGTDLYNALALLGASLETTIIADNIVADSWCGELYLNQAPVPVILEALLKSARVVRAAIQVDSGPGYIFIRSTQNRNRGNTCLNPEAITEEMRQRLEAGVELRLPRETAAPMFATGAATLAEALPELARQVGIEMRAEPAVADLPVNVAVFNEVSLETALNLIVWQWPVPGFGYRVTESEIVFCER